MLAVPARGDTHDADVVRAASRCTCRPGLCLRLYTRAQWARLAAQQVPEMRRAPLEPLCLNVKATLPDCSVREVLSRALDPPDAAAVDNALSLLRTRSLLEMDGEALTPLGAHLTSLPVDPAIGAPRALEAAVCARRCRWPVCRLPSRARGADSRTSKTSSPPVDVCPMRLLASHVVVLLRLRSGTALMCPTAARVRRQGARLRDYLARHRPYSHDRGGAEPRAVGLPEPARCARRGRRRAHRAARGQPAGRGVRPSRDRRRLQCFPPHRCVRLALVPPLAALLAPHSQLFLS